MRRYAFVGQDLLVPPDPARGPAVPEPSWLGLSAGATLIREFDDLRGSRACACVVSDGSAAPFTESGQLCRITLREALGVFGADEMHAAVRGYALIRALEASRFCGFCGGEMRDNGPEGIDGSGRVCSACGRLHFPRISPAVIVLIRKGQRALVAHNAHFPAGLFGLIAGFVEAGESLEEAAMREAREEAGIEIGGLRYAMSQSWPFPDSLMLAFTAEWKSGETRPDGEEITELRWCLPSELPDIPPKGSVARRLLDEFAAGR